MSGDWFIYVGFVALWGIVAYLWRAACRHARDGDGEDRESVRWLLRTFVAGGITYAVALPPIRAWLGHVVGIPGIAWLLLLYPGVVSGWTLQRYWSAQAPGCVEGRRAAIGSNWLAGGTLAALTASLLVGLHNEAGRASISSPPIPGVRPRGDIAVTLTIVLIYVGYMGLAAYRLLHLARFAARLLPDAHLRRRARLYVIGWGFAIGANLGTAVHAVALYLQVAEGWTTAAKLLTSGVLTCCQIALMSPSLFMLIDWLQDRRQVYGDYRALGPLLELVRPEQDAPPALRSPDDARYQRVIAIRDGISTLRRYQDAAVIARAQAHCRAAGLTGEVAQATVEGRTLLAAAEARRQGTAYRRSAPTLPDPPDPSLAGEVRYLRAVAATLQDPPSAACRHAPTARGGGDRLTPALTPADPSAEGGVAAPHRREPAGGGRRRRSPNAARSRP